jgi:hypothetical protein
MTTTSVTIFYVADIATGWVALLHASQDMSIGDDDLAKSVFESMRVSGEASCFREEISELLR